MRRAIQGGQQAAAHLTARRGGWGGGRGAGITASSRSADEEAAGRGAIQGGQQAAAGVVQQRQQARQRRPAELLHPLPPVTCPACTPPVSGHIVTRHTPQPFTASPSDPDRSPPGLDITLSSTLSNPTTQPFRSIQTPPR